jgi:3-hydroxyacyl-CoA dehydrogenase/enoyl-CoA hydratase/3-hydroxybutyryl-CoA epimerase
MTAFTLTEVTPGIYKLLFDLPGEKVNILSIETMKELGEILDKLKALKGVKGLIIISGKKDIFIAGADVKQFKPAFEDPALGKKLIDQGQDVYNKLAALPFPVVAAINGACLGGGTELALACSHRIATDNPKTVIGLPETQLGIIPGWGGTQRLPRLVGLQQGVEMIASGAPVKGAKALKIGLVDALAAPEFLESAALKFIQNPKKRKIKRGALSWLLEKNPLGRSLLFSQARKAILKKTKGFYPAPLLALDVIQKTAGMPLKKGLQVEADAFIQNASDHVDVATHLINIFFGQEQLKKQAGFPGDLPKGRPVKDVAVLGAGTMGGGIAWLFCNKLIPVRVKDINWEAIGHATQASWEVFSKLLKKRKTTPNEATRKFHELSWTLDYSGFDKVDFIVESAIEDLGIKRKIYQEVEAVVSNDTIIATNTSSLRISDLAEGLKHPERFVGMHFFNPAPLMPLVEVIAGPKTSAETVATTIELAKRLGKVPLFTGDCNGFLVNRVFIRAANEALFLLQEGVPLEQLDKAMLAFGMPMGSCELIDEVGIDVTAKVSKITEAAYGPRMATPPLLKKLYEEKLLGKKSGSGFYLHKGKNKSPNPKAKAIIKSFAKTNPLLTDDQIIERILLAMIQEASLCLEEKIVSDPKFVDLAMVFGTGFPPFRGGVLAYADSIGLPQVQEKLEALAKRFPERFEPTAQIKEMAKHNRTFVR